jgi:hypothetical protein
VRALRVWSCCVSSLCAVRPVDVPRVQVIEFPPIVHGARISEPYIHAQAIFADFMFSKFCVIAPHNRTGHVRSDSSKEMLRFNDDFV